MKYSFIFKRHSRSSLKRWRLYCWARLVLPLWCSDAGPAECCRFRSDSRYEPWNLQSWHTNITNELERNTQMINTRGLQRLDLQRAANTHTRLEIFIYHNHSETHPDASRSHTGFQAQMKTSDSWPLNTVALLAEIWISPSTSMNSTWLSVMHKTPLTITNTHFTHNTMQSFQYED